MDRILAMNSSPPTTAWNFLVSTFSSKSSAVMGLMATKAPCLVSRAYPPLVGLSSSWSLGSHPYVFR